MLHHKTKHTFQAFFLDNENTRQQQLVYLEMILGTIGAVMSVINIITHKDALLISTALMAVLSFANALFISKVKSGFFFAKIIFCLKMFALFSYFIIFGGTEGFSTIWLLLLPACGMFAFGRRIGTYLSAALFVELVAFFYTPLRDTVLQCEEYTPSFITRFPVVYCCFFAIGYFLEYVREITYKEMNRLRNEAKEQARHDALTGVYNRLGFDDKLSLHIKNAAEGIPFALLFIDVDKFKDINDSYGHKIGDKVLRVSVERITSILQTNGVVCRWGGDEFAVIIDSHIYDEWQSIAESIRASLSQPVVADGLSIRMTISIGGVGSGELSEPTALSLTAIADKRLYSAKINGRNRFVGQDE